MFIHLSIIYIYIYMYIYMAYTNISHLHHGLRRVNRPWKPVTATRTCRRVRVGGRGYYPCFAFLALPRYPEVVFLIIGQPFSSDGN